MQSHLLVDADQNEAFEDIKNSQTERSENKKRHNQFDSIRQREVCQNRQQIAMPNITPHKKKKKKKNAQ